MRGPTWSPLPLTTSPHSSVNWGIMFTLVNYWCFNQLWLNSVFRKQNYCQLGSPVAILLLDSSSFPKISIHILLDHFLNASLSWKSSSPQIHRPRPTQFPSMFSQGKSPSLMNTFETHSNLIYLVSASTWHLPALVLALPFRIQLEKIPWALYLHDRVHSNQATLIHIW